MKSEKNGNLFYILDNEEKIVSGVGVGVGKSFVAAYFPEAQSKIRIATAFFSLRGYKIAEKYFDPDARIWILIGRDQDAAPVMEAIVDQILSDLGQCEELMSATVERLKTKVERKQCVIRDARKMKTLYHCKFYVCDEKLMFHGSANFSDGGLSKNAEQVSRTYNRTEIDTFIEWYDKVSKNAPDIYENLLKCLNDWLALARPFDIYLKTLSLLDKHADYKRGAGAKTPTYYQKAAAAQALNQIQTYGGALIVAATGLGKTIIGAEIAAQSVNQDKILHVVLIAPESVHPNWRDELDERYLSYRIFNNEVLFRADSSAEHHKINQIVKQLKRAGEETLIVVDEAHLYRNELLSEEANKRKSLVYERLGAAVKAGAKIVLLTATAYGTSAQNFNSLLHLLPRRNENHARRTQRRLFEQATVWEVESAEEFAELPVVTILGLPHVLKMARDKNHENEDGRIFIQLGDRKNYLPRTIKLRRIRYELFQFEELKNAFDNQYFDQADNITCTYYDEDRSKKYERGSVNSIYENSISSWLSSPESMRRSLEQNINTPGKDDAAIAANGSLFDYSDEAEEFSPDQSDDNEDSDAPLLSYRAPMMLKQTTRAKNLDDILKNLRNFSAEADNKFAELKAIVDERRRDARGKIIVFVRRHTTACYLAEALRKYSDGKLRIGCTIKSCGTKPKLAPSHKRAELRKRFRRNRTILKQLLNSTC